MSTYIEHVEDEHGDLVDILVYCSAACADQYAPLAGRWPSGPPEQDSDTYCAGCEDHIAHGLQCPAWATGDDADCEHAEPYTHPDRHPIPARR